MSRGKLAGKEYHKNNQALSKVVWWSGRKSGAGILDRDVEEKNNYWVGVPRLSAVSLPKMPTWLEKLNSFERNDKLKDDGFDNVRMRGKIELY